MGLFDAFRSKPAEEADAPPPSIETDLSSAAAPSPADVAATIKQSSGGTLPSGEADFYNPYKGLQSSLDMRGPGDTAARTGFKVSHRPEFVFMEEKSVKRRSWSENLTYYTGVAYLGGAAMGGGIGAYAAMQSRSAAPTLRLQLNRLLNTAGASGRLYGNSVGVIGLYFASSESVLLNYLERQPGIPDAVSTLGAGFITGSLYRIARGPRPAVVAGLVGSAGAGLLLVGRSFVSGL